MGMLVASASGLKCLIIQAISPTDFVTPCFKVLIITWFLESSAQTNFYVLSPNLKLKMKLKKLLLFVLMVSSRRINRRDAWDSFRDTFVSLGTQKHGHAIRDEAVFYDFMSLSLEFNRQNLDEFVRVNLDPTFAGFTDNQFDSLMENWIYGMLAGGYWSIFLQREAKISKFILYFQNWPLINWLYYNIKFYKV